MLSGFCFHFPEGFSRHSGHLTESKVLILAKKLQKLSENKEIITVYLLYSSSLKPYSIECSDLN